MKYNDNIKHGSQFYAWQPSTWPNPPQSYDADFAKTLETIFRDSLLTEIENVIKDASTIEHRGHVVALSILCAIDALSSYAFRRTDIDRCKNCGRTDRTGPRYKKYISDFFPKEYKPFAAKIYNLYRNSIAHNWNLFKAGMLPGSEPIVEHNGVISLGLLNFFCALKQSVKSFIEKLKSDAKLQENALLQYTELRQLARP